MFTGESSYAQNLQSEIARQVAIASLPIQLLQNQQTALTNQSNELKTLDTKFAALQTAVRGISEALSGSSYQADISDPTVVSATLADGAQEGVYAIQVSDIGSYATSLTRQSWNTDPDPSGQPTTYTLTIGNNNYSITGTDNSAASVASAINSRYGNLVRATVVNVGPSNAPDYRISLEATSLGPETLGIQGPLSLQTQQPLVNGCAVSQTALTWRSTGQAATYDLVLGNQAYSFTAADDSAATVASTINAQFGSQVQATVVDLGSDGNHDYRIQLQSTTPGAMNLDIEQTGASLQTQQQSGSLAQYQVNNSGVTVTSNTRSVSIASGVTLNLLSTSSSPVNITVTRSSSTLSSALSAFATAYNAAFSEVNAQRGQSGGPLQANPIVGSLARTLSGIATYSSSDTVNSLASLGLDLGTDGQITFNPMTFMATGFFNSTGVTAFLGSATSGGFLKVATDALNSLEDSSAGLLKNAETDTQNQISELGNQITTKQNQVAQLQTNLQNQMAQADAMIAMMQQQYSYLTEMYQIEQANAQMYK
jgi:flagellar hook-associated protein 2